MRRCVLMVLAELVALASLITLGTASATSSRFAAGNIEARVEALLKQMTLEEKVNQLLIPEDDPTTIMRKYGTLGLGATYIYSVPNSSIALRFV